MMAGRESAKFSGMNAYNLYTDVMFVSAGIPNTVGLLTETW
ncbi:unnamed protein product, partial [Linum tenue]